MKIENRKSKGRKPETERDRQIVVEYWTLRGHGMRAGDAIRKLAEDYFRSTGRIRNILIRERHASSI